MAAKHGVSDLIATGFRKWMIEETREGRNVLIYIVRNKIRSLRLVFINIITNRIKNGHGVSRFPVLGSEVGRDSIVE